MSRDYPDEIEVPAFEMRQVRSQRQVDRRAADLEREAGDAGQGGRTAGRRSGSSLRAASSSDADADLENAIAAHRPAVRDRERAG